MQQVLPPVRRFTHAELMEARKRTIRHLYSRLRKLRAEGDEHAEHVLTLWLRDLRRKQEEG